MPPGSGGIFQRVKGLAEFCARRRKRNLIVFSGGMYVGKNTLRAASVRPQGAREAQRSLLKKVAKPLF